MDAVNGERDDGEVNFSNKLRGVAALVLSRSPLSTACPSDAFQVPREGGVGSRYGGFA